LSTIRAPLNPAVADELFKVGREAISNAFRHAQAKSIRVEVEYRNRDLKLLIRDNGLGIDERLLIEGKLPRRSGIELNGGRTVFASSSTVG
jgi:signal transduction histidine kinase